LNLNSDQPTAVVYRTVKGHKYGIEGRLSHGAGHKYCSEGYFSALKEAEDHFSVQFPRNSSGTQSQEANEKMFYDTLLTIRSVIEKRKDLSKFACTRIIEAEEKLSKSGRKPREKAPDLSKIYPGENISPYSRPSEACFSAGQKITLREALGLSINCLNKITGGAFFGTTADLLDSTSLSKMNLGFPAGLYSSEKNPFSRLIAMGGICEDAMGAFMAGLSSFGRHIGVSASYGAFIASLEHIAARLHGIAQQAKHSDGYRTWIMVNAHTGLKTGEDGPTHACPQSLQLLQENFPKGVLITLTPWEPNEVWPLLIAGLTAKPAVLAPFTTRPPETVPDRQKLKLPPVHAVIKGIYAMRKADPSSKQQNGTIVLQGSGVTYNFVFDVLPKLDEMGLNINVYYVTSAELFESLPLEEQEELFSEETCRTAMGITDFTLPTMYKWIGSREGLKRTLHPFRNGHYPGSGQGDRVLAEAGLDAKSQLEHILEYVRDFEKRCQVSGVRCQE
jgi:transketolase